MTVPHASPENLAAFRETLRDPAALPLLRHVLAVMDPADPALAEMRSSLLAAERAALRAQPKQGRAA